MNTSPDSAVEPARRALPVGAVLRPVLPFLVALVIGAVVLLATGHDPLDFYQLLVREAFGGTDRIAATLSSATPLLFTGLATAIAFRAGVFNVGVEGGFLLSGLVTATVAVHVSGPLVVPVAMLAGAAAGVLVSVGPGWLRARWGVDEVVTTLMVNFVVTGVTGWLVTSFLQARGVANAATPLIARSAWLPDLLPPDNLTSGVLIGLGLAVTYAVWIRHSVLGYELRQTGLNQRFAAAQGIRVGKVIVVAMVISGAIAGLGGAAHALGVVHRYVDGFSPGYGFTGIAVALLGRNSAVGVVIGAVLFGALASAGTTAQLFSDIPLDIVNVLSGTVMVFAVVRLWRRR
ncbi:ABC transporter permease [Actinocrispum wychmicini]|uniref:Simple sugar transport system permease protein n=1 Tax=Actinocrispum wychmicini TaxID=1213861 RepID=A0A4R2IRG7_9PSEU|nr:ABC transporter permease [Actinocrispum wychmicini]TCO47961.1 simple sugar transport system permease protein [Actinocrispum wychmicini]